MSYKIIHGDNIDTLKQYPDNHFDSIVTDPPYGIEFLGKDWDNNTGAVETWEQCFRVLKPGGHLLAFSAARTYHHLASNIESVGFDIRDQLMWLYASGFPKAQDIGKAINRRGDNGEQWNGWKTALKPAHEPIVMARKPFKGSTIDNVLEHGTGALNIDATRIETDDVRSGGANGLSRLTFGEGETSNEDSSKAYTPSELGRYPSNVLGEVEGYQKYFYCPKVSRAERHIGFDEVPDPLQNYSQGDYTQTGTLKRMKDKMHQTQVGNNHPTVKPVELMKYLVRLVTPENGKVLDPFNGSGSTGMACVELGYEYVGCELDQAYVDIATKRIEGWIKHIQTQKTAHMADNNYNELFE